jgi:hypothetical protein
MKTRGKMSPRGVVQDGAFAVFFGVTDVFLVGEDGFSVGSDL